MTMLRLHPDILAVSTSGVWYEARKPGWIAGFCFDAREIAGGECFVALSGGARDGHTYIEQAVAGGATAVLVEHPVAVSIPQLVVDDSLVALGAIGAAVRQSFTKPVLGVTGSSGKTSTKEMLRLLLGEGRTHATAGNWNNRIGVPMTLLGLDHATHDFGVIEAGINQPEEMDHLGAMIRGDLTVVTNVGPAHLERLGTLEQVASEKARLAEQAVAGSPIILPHSALQFSAFQKLSSRAIVVVEAGVACRGEDVRRMVRYTLNRVDESGTSSGVGHAHRLELADGAVRASYMIASTSRGLATNAALAIVAARECGISEEAIRERIEGWRPASNRGCLVRRGGQTFYIDCYNANPASMEDALSAFQASVPTQEPRAYILGAMNELGARAESLHRAVGRQLELRAQDRAFFVGPQSLVEAYRTGALDVGAAVEQLACAETADQIKSGIAEFEGAFFLKGSRSYTLEKLLPDAL